MLHFSNEINRNNLKNSVLMEYFQIKDENPECIILFQIGHFFETLFEDARLFSEISGLNLGVRHFSGIGDVIQSGFPLPCDVNIYIRQLLNNGYKVCLCPEFKDEDNICHRRVVRTFTKGTIIESELLESSENNYILVLCKTKKNKFQIAYADVSTGQFYKTSGEFEEIRIEIEKIEPCEVLLLKSQEKSFKDVVTKYNVTFIEDEICEKDINVEALIKQYCRKTQREFCTKLDEIIEYNIDNYLSMDEITRRNLELTRTKRFLKKKGSLLWFLNYTKTPMGIRLLKKYMSEPLLSVEKITNRQDAVCELIETPELLDSFERVMQDFCDLSRGCTKISNETVYPKDLYSIAQNSTPLEELHALCNGTKSNLLKLDEKKIEDTINFAGEIKRAIKQDAASELKSGGIIKEGYCANLDYLRDKFEKCKKDMDNYQESERKRLNIKNLKVSHANVFGFYIEVTSPNAHKVSSDYLKKQVLTTCVRYTTEKLQDLEQKYSTLKVKINEMEYDLYCEIRRHAMQFVDTIRTLAKQIARIDVLVSYSRCAIENNLVRPVFNESGIFITDGFHPSLIKLKNEIVKNDTNIKNGEMIVMTGANMSGKSTYLKYNAIIALLSQIGSFVPAKNADMTIVDKIFVRQGSTDDIINNNSSFMVEMNDLKFIIDNITNSSFVLLDEPAKSTNATEGGAIARAFCEYLLKNYQAKILVATHNLELTKIENVFPNRAYNYVIGNSDVSQVTISDRRIKRGIINSSLAINTATLAKLPREIIQNAKMYAAS